MTPDELAKLESKAAEMNDLVRELERRLVRFSDQYNLTVAVLRRLYPHLLALHQNARDIPKEFTAAIEAARDLLSFPHPAPVVPAPTLTLLPKANHEG